MHELSRILFQKKSVEILLICGKKIFKYSISNTNCHEFYFKKSVGILLICGKKIFKYSISNTNCTNYHEFYFKKNLLKSVLSVKSVAKIFNAINHSLNPENNLQIVQRAIHPSNRDAREQTLALFAFRFPKCSFFQKKFLDNYLQK